MEEEITLDRMHFFFALRKMEYSFDIVILGEFDIKNKITLKDMLDLVLKQLKHRKQVEKCTTFRTAMKIRNYLVDRKLGIKKNIRCKTKMNDIFQMNDIFPKDIAAAKWVEFQNAFNFEIGDLIKTDFLRLVDLIFLPIIFIAVLATTNIKIILFFLLSIIFFKYLTSSNEFKVIPYESFGEMIWIIVSRDYCNAQENSNEYNKNEVEKIFLYFLSEATSYALSNKDFSKIINIRD